MKWVKWGVVLFYAGFIAINAFQVYRIAFVRHEADFVACLAAAHDLRSGTNPYVLTAVAPYNTLDNARPYIYPIFLAWVWIPFTYLIPVAASFVWYGLSLVLMFVSLLLCLRLLGIRNKNDTWILIGVTGILFVSIFQWVLMFGHEDFLVLLLLLLAAYYLTKRKSAAGSFVGMAISAKLMPIVVAPMLLRRWRAILICVATIIVVCVVIPYLIAGNAIFGYYNYWIHDTLGSEMSSGDEALHSFALAGAVAQLFGLTHPTLAIKLLCGLLLLSFPMILLWKDRILPAFFLSMMLIPLCSTRSEPNHLTMIAPAVMLLCSQLITRRMVYRGQVIVLSSKHAMLGWLVIVTVQLMILWGYNALIPVDTIGMLVVFGLVFWQGLASNERLAPRSS